MNALAHQCAFRYGTSRMKTRDGRSRVKLASSIAKLGDGVAYISEIGLLQKIDEWEQQKFKLEIDELNCNENAHQRQLQITSKRKRELNTKNCWS